MANLTFIEKQRFESLFDMSGGYVLDFTNRSFQQFVFDSIQIDVYKKYQNLSKARMLRAIMQESSNETVGKLLLLLLEYMQFTGKINDDNRKEFNECAKIGNRLIGKYRTDKVKKSSTDIEKRNKKINYGELEKGLYELSKLDDAPQKRGYAFEKYLYNLFNEFDLKPRESFKIIGEQIDGSFEMDNEIYLLEAKWTNTQQIKDDLVVFNEKVSSKSTFTRGLFISFSGYSENAVKTFVYGRKSSIILMTVSELAISFERGINFKSLLKKKIRALAEEGEVLKNVLS